MEKRLILAVTLSMIVLLSWSALTSKTQIPVNKEVIDIKPPEVKANELLKPVPVKEFIYTRKSFDIAFDEKTASILHVVFKEYQDYKFELYRGLALNVNNLVFSLNSSKS
ncbi:hypothetical protein EPO66_06435, partial [bacterium]